MSKEKPTTKIVMLVACRDKTDNKIRFDVDAVVELETERAEAAVAAGYAKPAEPEI